MISVYLLLDVLCLSEESRLVFHQLAVATFLYVFVAKSACLVYFVFRVCSFEEEYFAVAFESKNVRTDTV